MRDQLIFPEIDYSKVEKLKGMNITIVTTAPDDNQARSLLKAFWHSVPHDRGIADKQVRPAHQGLGGARQTAAKGRRRI